MKKLLTGALLLATPTAYAYDCPEFTTDQLHVLQTVYDVGKEHDLGYTLSAISWRESRAGEALLNINNNGSVDVGSLMINSKTASNMFEVKGYKLNLVLTQLTIDVEFAAETSVGILTWWYKQHGDWATTVASYNSGYNTTYGMNNYVPHIKENIVMLKNCVRL